MLSRLLPHPLECQNIPDGCIIPCYPRNIKFPAQNPADSRPTCPTVSAVTWLPHLALFTSIYCRPQPLPNSPALLHTPALPSGTLSRSPNLPAHLKDPLVILTSPGTHGSIPIPTFFGWWGIPGVDLWSMLGNTQVLIYESGHYRWSSLLSSGP